MFIDENELFNWEIEQEQRDFLKLYGLSKKPKDPKKEKSYEYDRKKKKFIHWYKKETSWAKRNYQKKFRSKWNQEFCRGDWHRPVNKEYHTYGYLTW